MAFRAGSGSVQAVDVRTGGSGKAARIVTDVGTPDILESNNVSIAAGVEIGGINAAQGNVQAQAATASGSGTAQAPVRTASGTVQASESSAVGSGGRKVSGDGVLAPTPSQTTANVERSLSGSGVLYAARANTNASGKVARRIVPGTGAAISGDSSVTGAGVRIVTSQGDLQAQESDVSSTASLERLVKWEGPGDAFTEPSTVQGAARRIITSSGDLQARNAKTRGDDFVVLVDAKAITFCIKPSDLDFEIGVGGSVYTVPSTPKSSVQDVDTVFSIEEVEFCVPVPLLRETQQTEVIRYLVDPGKPRHKVRQRSERSISVSTGRYAIATQTTHYDMDEAA